MGKDRWPSVSIADAHSTFILVSNSSTLEARKTVVKFDQKMTDSNIITRCPQCNTAFRVSNNQLSVADGTVRCGSCLGLFKAIDFKASQKETALPITKIQESQHKLASRQSSNTGSTVPKNQVKAAGDDNNQLIDDGINEAGLYQKDDIAKLNTSDENRTTALFERKLKPIAQTQEQVDERWALDMLSALKDEDEEDIKPLQSKDKPKRDTSTRKGQQPKATTQRKTEHKPQQSKNREADMTTDHSFKQSNRAIGNTHRTKTHHPRRC